MSSFNLMSQTQSSPFEWMVNAARELMTLINREHVIEAANDAYCRAWNLPREKIVGKTLAQLWGQKRYETQIAPLLEQAFTSKKVVEYESHFQFSEPGGSDFRVVFYPYPGEDHEVTHVVCITIDISRYKKAEENLRSAEQKYRQLVEHSNAVIYLDNNDDVNSNIYTSPQILNLTGYAPEEWMSDPELYIKIIHPDDRQRVLDANERTNKEQLPFLMEYRIITRDGRVVWVRDDAILVKEHDGRLIWQGVMHDITASKLMEEKLRQAEQQYRQLVEQVQAVIYLDRDDDQNSSLYISPQIERLIGYTPQEWLNDPDLWLKLLHPDDRERVLAEINRRGRVNGHLKQEYRLITRDGQEIWVMDDSALIIDFNGERVWHGSLYDITALKHAETALQHRLAIEEQISHISTNLINTPFERMEEEIQNLLATVGKICGADQSFLCLLGENLQYVKSYEWLSTGSQPMVGELAKIPVDKIPWTISRLKNQKLVVLNRRRGGHREATTEFKILKAALPEVQSTLIAPLGSENILLGIMGINMVKEDKKWLVEDIQLLSLVSQTVFNSLERQRIEGAVRENEEKFRRIFELSPLGITLVDNELTILDINPTAQAIHRFNAGEDAIGRNMIMYISESDRPKFRELIRKVQQDIPSITTEVSLLTKDDTLFPAELSFCRVRDAQGNPTGFLLMSEDISNRKQSEQELHTARVQLAQRVNELESRTQQLSQLTEMTNLLQLCAQEQEAFTIISNFTSRLFPNLPGALYTYDDPAKPMELRTSWGKFPLSSVTITRQDCWALRRGRVYSSDNPLTSLVCKHVTEPLPGSYVCIPITVSGTEIGLYHLQSSLTGHPLSDDQIQLATVLAEQVGLALSNLRLRENLRQQAIHDPLTGLYNRYYLEEFLEIELHRARRNNQPVTIFMLDLDFFKGFNDRFGHPAGDNLLRELGKLLSASVRSGDIIFRYGGDEFTLILPNTDLEVATQRAEELRKLVENLVVQQEGLTLRDFTISVGVANSPRHGIEVADILRNADRALYTAKKEGRNRVIIANPTLHDE